jgi:hypothetical protein
LSKEKEIRDMAKLTILENKLNDLQIKNLKMFPLVFFDGVSEAKIDYDFSVEKPSVEYEITNKDNPDKIGIKYEFDKPKPTGRIEYDLTIEHDGGLNSKLPYRFQSLEYAVRSLFWKEVKVTVLFNGKKVYESKDV